MLDSLRARASDRFQRDLTHTLDIREAFEQQGESNFGL